ncbi:putative hypothetical protein [Clostridium botulinum BKT015925]|nr:putative hypothetical protein [Clostridium botulinum BKT015925]
MFVENVLNKIQDYIIVKRIISKYTKCQKNKGGVMYAIWR